MARRMETDESVIVLGEDVNGLKGGTNGATKRPLELFPDRVLGTPISENAFAGLGGGMALDGRFRPVVEFMYADFMWVAADQLFNQVAKARHMFGGDSAVPFVLRSKLAAGTGYGSQHSMDPAGVLTTAPGSAGGRAVHALRLRRADEHRDGVQRPGRRARARRPLRGRRDRPGGRPRLPHPGRQGRPAAGGIRRHRHLLPVDGGSLRRGARPGAGRLGRPHRPALARPCLDRLGHDRAPASARPTGSSSSSRAPSARRTARWLADEIQRRLFDWLDAPIERVTGGEASPSISKVLERAAIARTEEVVAALRAAGHELTRRQRSESRHG